MSTFEIFKSFSIGGINKEELISKLTACGVQFNKYALTLFDHPAFSPEDKTQSVDLVKVILSDLGISQPCPYNEIVSAASHAGLKLCPLYLGAFLRLEFLDQLEGPYLTIASPKLENDEDYPNGLYVRNLDGVLWLRGYRASDDYDWPLESEFIFILPGSDRSAATANHV